MNHRNRFVDKNTMLVREFDRYVLEHPEFAEKIPDNASSRNANMLVMMNLMNGPDERLKAWLKKIPQ